MSKTNNMCPYGIEFDQLVKHPEIGLFEAMKDWMEQDGVVRTVDQVLAKLKGSVTPAVKPGVQELFDSNSELANQVYKALGFTISQLPTIDTENIISFEGTKGAAQYNRENNQIKVNRKFLKQKFEEKAWTKPRKLIETLHGKTIESYAQALPENQFKTYEEWEKFVINHEYQHSLYSRQDFDKDFPNKTKGDYESEINTRALNQITPQQKQQALQLYSQYLDTIFPDSKVKDIVRHDTDYKFWEGRLPNGKDFNSKRGIYFNATSGDEGGFIGATYKIKAIINLLNPAIKDMDKDYGGKNTNELYPNNDGVIGYIENINQIGEYIVSKSEQIHVLGSKQDIEGFKEFVDKSEPKKTTQFFRQPESTNDLAVNQIIPFDVTLSDTQSDRALEITRKLLDRLSQQVGINYQFITPEEAGEITAGSNNPYNGEPAFYYNGIAYFIKGKISLNSIFHEFGHPIIHGIAQNNKVLFEKLYKDLSNTEEGQNVIKYVTDKYKELKPDSQEFKEEVIVQVLGLSAAQKFNDLKQSTGFLNWLKEIFYQIKQFLRKTFGNKINISKLDETSTIEDLANMLAKGGEFKIETEAINQADVVKYTRDRISEIEDLSKVAPKELTKMTTTFFEVASRQINLILRNKNYKEMLDVLADEYKRGDLQEIKSNLYKFQQDLEQKMLELKDEVEYTQSQAEALVNSFYRLKKVLEKIDNQLASFQKEDVNNQDNLQRAFYYKKVVDYWYGAISHTLDVFNKTEGVSKDNDLYKLVSSLNGYVQSINTKITSMYSEGVKDLLYNTLLPMSGNMQARFDSIIDTLTRNNASQASRDRQFKEYYGMIESDYKKYAELKKLAEEGNLPYEQTALYDKLKRTNLLYGQELTKEKIDETLAGKLGDASWANSFLEGYLYNQDPIVGGFSLYVKRAMDEVIIKAQARYNDIATELRPLLEKAGYNPTNIGELGRRIGFVDVVGRINPETGEVDKKEIWTLLNPWKDYRYDIAIMDDKIKKAKIKYNTTNTKEDRTQFYKLIEEKNKHLRKYFYQQYSQEYYNIRDKYTQDDLGKVAFGMRDEILDELKSIQEKITNERDVFDTQTKVDEVWRKYKLLMSNYDIDGNLKSEEDLKIAKRLQEYVRDTRKFYEYKERPGLFQNAYFKYKQSLLNRGLDPDNPDDAEGQMAMSLWLDRNMRVAIKQEFWKDRRKIIDRIKEIQSKITGQDKTVTDLADSFEELFDNMSGFRDEDGQPNGSIMSEGRISNVKRLQEKINALRDQLTNISGLSKKEQRRLNELSNLTNPTPEEINEKIELFDKLNTQGLSQALQNELNGKFEELNEIQTTVATEYYIDQVNYFISYIKSPVLEKMIGKNYLDATNIDTLYDPDVLEDLKKDKKFEQWFDKNHIEIMKYDREKKRDYPTYQRLYIWNVIKPTDPKYYETTQIKDENGNDVFDTPIRAIPSQRFYTRVVKDFYEDENSVKIPIKTGYDFNMFNERTQTNGKVNLIVGKHIDNKGNWLPREDVSDNPYRNEKYYELRDKDPASFELLQALTKHHLKNQDGLSSDAKLYLDFPRFEKSVLEAMQSRRKMAGGDGENFFQYIIRRIKEFFIGAKETIESGYNYKPISEEDPGAGDEMRLVNLDLYDNETSKIPMNGLYDIDYQDVSTDFVNGMLRYMLSAERHKKLVEINPAAQAIKTVLDNNNLKDVTKVNKSNYVNHGETTYANVKERYIRKKAVDALIAREFEGEINTGAFSDSAFMQNLSNGLFQTASLGFFALNIPSALKNSLSAKYQAMLEAAAGRYFNMKDFARAEGWAFKTMGEVSFQIYKMQPKSLNVQIWELFDPVVNFEDKFRKEGLSRTIAKDVTDFSWLMSFRKWTEAQASMQMFGAYMMRQKVETKDGKKIDYIDAWEVKDGKIQLKDNILPEYGITYDKDGNMIIGEIFKQRRQEIQAVLRNLQGAYDKFNQPDAQRYLAFRFISYLRRYFTTMFIDRFGFRYVNGMLVARYQPGLGTLAEGFYITFFKFLGDVLRTGPKRFTFLLPDEKRAMLKIGTDVIALALLYYAQNFLFGWDAEDEDKYEKLRQKSGALRAPFVTDDEYAFNMKGWLSNHALSLLMQTHAEQFQFLPLPGLGLKQYTEMLDLTSAAFGPTLETYGKIFDSLAKLATGNEGAYYDKEVGPYEWQQAEGVKVINFLAKSIGFTGTFMDPAIAVKNYVSVRSM